MRVKLTKASIDRLKAPTENAKQRLVWDSELVGFGILLSGTTASRTYVVQRNVRGKSVRVSVAPVNLMSLEQARTKASGLLVDMWNGINPKVERRAAKVRGMTLQQALDGYLASRKTLRATTAFEYQSSLKRYLGAWLNRPLAEIDPDMVEKRHEAIQKEIGERNIHKDGSIRNRLVTGGNAANGAMRSLRVVWNYAADKIPDLPPNPVKRLKKQWYPERRRDRVLRHDEMPIFWKALQGLEHLAQRDVNTLMLFTGMRRSEARPLLWTEADLTERVFRLPGSRTKTGRPLVIPMCDIVHDLLVSRRALGIEGPHVFPGASKDGPFVGDPRAGLRIIAEQTGIRISPHDLRRTFITTAESLDIGIFAIKRLVGHTLNDITGSYAMISVERLREPAQKIADRIKQLCGIFPVEDGKVAKLGRKPRA